MIKNPGTTRAPELQEQSQEKASPALSPMATSLGLSEADIVLMGQLFGEITAPLGINGEPVFRHLVQGESIGQALRIPDLVVEKIYTRAHSWFTLGRIDRAEPLFRALCLLRDEDADFWVGYGVCLRMTGQFERAEQAFDSAARLRSDWAVPYFHIFELTAHQKQWNKAKAALEAYEKKVTTDIDPKIKQEVERLRVALLMPHSDVSEDMQEPARKRD